LTLFAILLKLNINKSTVFMGVFMKNLLLSLCICFGLLQADPIDITDIFFKEVRRTTHQGLKAFSEQTSLFGNRPATRIFLKSQDEQAGEIIFQTGLSVSRTPVSKTPDTYNYINDVCVAETHRNNKLGSLLLRHVLGLCTGNCIETRLMAIPPSGMKNDYLALKRFYQAHGGVLDKKSELGLTGKFAFPPVLT
jgi:GNAT superfamily N-acetyltransferase